MRFDRRGACGFLPELPWLSIRRDTSENCLPGSGLGDAESKLGIGVRFVVGVGPFDPRFSPTECCGQNGKGECDP